MSKENNFIRPFYILRFTKKRGVVILKKFPSADGGGGQSNVGQTKRKIVRNISKMEKFKNYRFEPLKRS